MRALVLLLVPAAALLCSAEAMSFTAAQCRFLEQMHVRVNGICREIRGNARQAVAGTTGVRAAAVSPRATPAQMARASSPASSQGRASSAGSSRSAATGGKGSTGNPSTPGAPGTPGTPTAASLGNQIRGQVDAATAGLSGLGDNIRGQVNASVSGLSGLGNSIRGSVNSSLKR